MTAAADKLYEYLTDVERQTFQQFETLSTDDKLAWFYWVYQHMGDSITPAAPVAADPNLAPILLGDFYELPKDDQLTIMRQIVKKEDTEYSRYYGALAENNRLLVWYAWAQAMGDTVVGMPNDYSATQATQQLLDQIQKLDFQEQISILRTVVADMGYSDVGRIPTQAETGKTDSL